MIADSYSKLLLFAFAVLVLFIKFDTGFCSDVSCFMTQEDFPLDIGSECHIVVGNGINSRCTKPEVIQGTGPTTRPGSNCFTRIIDRSTGSLAKFGLRRSQTTSCEDFCEDENEVNDKTTYARCTDAEDNGEEVSTAPYNKLNLKGEYLIPAFGAAPVDEKKEMCKGTLICPTMGTKLLPEEAVVSTRNLTVEVITPYFAFEGLEDTAPSLYCLYSDDDGSPQWHLRSEQDEIVSFAVVKITLVNKPKKGPCRKLLSNNEEGAILNAEEISDCGWERCLRWMEKKQNAPKPKPKPKKIKHLIMHPWKKMKKFLKGKKKYMY